MTEHQSDDHLIHDPDHNEITAALPQTVEIVIYAIVSVFIIVTNSLTIAAVATRRKLRTIPNMYVTSLAVADLLIGVLVVIGLLGEVPAWAESVDRSRWWCVLNSAFVFVLVSLSTLNMLIIAADRYVCIMFPLRYPTLLTPRRALVVILISWTVAILYGLVLPVCSHDYQEEHRCQPTHVFPEAYMMGTHPAFFFFVSVLSGLLYALIMRVVVRQKRQIRLQVCNSGDRIEGKQQQQRSNGAARMLMLVFGLYFLCWCPLVVVMVLEYTVHISHLYLSVCSILVVLHSALNFFVYAASNRHFKHTFRVMLCPHSARARVEPEVWTTDYRLESH